MNKWTQKSIQLAQSDGYLDKLFEIYPTIPSESREISQSNWSKVEKAFEESDLPVLIENLLNFELFPIKDSYIAYLRHDAAATNKNPETIERIGNRILEMGLDKIYEKCSEPKETNRQIGPMFKNWINKGFIGLPVLNNVRDFLSDKKDAIYNDSDDAMKKFAANNLGYDGDKGIDFIARVKNKYVVGEAKFLTDFGGHQNAQLADALNLFDYRNVNARKIAILDGVPFLNNNNQMCVKVRQDATKDIMSALVLKEFLSNL